MANIWIIGAGIIAQEYSKVLTKLGKDFLVIGRGQEKVDAFIASTGHDAIAGGLESYLYTNPTIPEYAIVATNISSLSHSCISLMKFGVKKILCEKPGFCYPEECQIVANIAKETETKLFLAYNRRFFSSTLMAEKIIAEDGGLKSFILEFTEWGHVIAQYKKPKNDLDNWFYANSTHVVDLAFFFGGMPIKLNAFSSGEISWHKPAVFSGAGITEKEALFSYYANWAAPGRWGVELLTSQHRLYLRPMEQLQIQNIGSVAVNPVEIDNSLDKEFKPGFFLETKSFLNGDYSRLCSIDEQNDHLNNIYLKMMGK